MDASRRGGRDVCGVFHGRFEVAARGLGHARSQVSVRVERGAREARVHGAGGEILHRAVVDVRADRMRVGADCAAGVGFDIRRRR